MGPSGLAVPILAVVNVSVRSALVDEAASSMAEPEQNFEVSAVGYPIVLPKWNDPHPGPISVISHAGSSTVLISIPDVSVRWTGHLSAISSRRSRCSVLS